MLKHGELSSSTKSQTGLDTHTQASAPALTHAKRNIEGIFKRVFGIFFTVYNLSSVCFSPSQTWSSVKLQINGLNFTVMWPHFLWPTGADALFAETACSLLAV